MRFAGHRPSATLAGASSGMPTALMLRLAPPGLFPAARFTRVSAPIRDASMFRAPVPHLRTLAATLDSETGFRAMVMVSMP